MTHLAGTDAPRAGRDTEAGFSLTELIVSMAIFAVVISIFLAGLASMSQSTVRAQDVANAGDAVRLAFQTMDKQIRYASSINSPGVGSSGAHYVEFITTAQPNGQNPLCTQWRYDPTERTLAYRTWRDQPVSTKSEWRTVAFDLRNDLSGATPNEPFELVFASEEYVRQQLVVSLDAGRTETSEPGAEMGTTFVARNSSDRSTSNLDLDGNGISDAFVCSSHLERP